MLAQHDQIRFGTAVLIDLLEKLVGRRELEQPSDVNNSSSTGVRSAPCAAVDQNYAAPEREFVFSI